MSVTYSRVCVQSHDGDAALDCFERAGTWSAEVSRQPRHRVHLHSVTRPWLLRVRLSPRSRPKTYERSSSGGEARRVEGMISWRMLEWSFQSYPSGWHLPCCSYSDGVTPRYRRNTPSLTYGLEVQSSMPHERGSSERRRGWPSCLSAPIHTMGARTGAISLCMAVIKALQGQFTASETIHDHVKRSTRFSLAGKF